jgi:hypothetical protein
MKDLLSEIENVLEDLNSRFGDEKELCLFCNSNQYSSVSGVIHSENCLILRLRKILNDMEVNR